MEKEFQETNKEFKKALADKLDAQQKPLSDKLTLLDERMRWIDRIPTIPVRWPSILRISFGVVVSVFSPFAQDWLVGYFLSFS